jgi:thioredoxin 1
MNAIPYLLVGFAALIMGMQLWAFWNAKRKQGQPAPDYKELLPEAAVGMRRHLFYFYGERCGPCRALTPMIDRLATRHPNLLKMDVALHPEIARQFGVMGTPTFVLVEAGTVAKVILGAVSEKKLADLLGEGS